MTTLNISLPDSMRAFIEEQTKTGGFSTASEYLRSLIREDQKRRGQQRLEELLLQGLESGGPERLGPEDWDDVRRRVKRHLKERHKRAR